MIDFQNVDNAVYISTASPPTDMVYIITQNYVYTDPAVFDGKCEN
jgi:hypothetical protein